MQPGKEHVQAYVQYKSMYNPMYHVVVHRALKTVRNHQSQKYLDAKNSTHILHVCIIIWYVDNFTTFIPVIPATTPTSTSILSTMASIRHRFSLVVELQEPVEKIDIMEITCVSLFSYLIIRATSSKGDGGCVLFEQLINQLLLLLLLSLNLTLNRSHIQEWYHWNLVSDGRLIQCTLGYTPTAGDMPFCGLDAIVK